MVYRILIVICFLSGFSLYSQSVRETESRKNVSVAIDFGQTLQDWDGFGVNYVQTRHTRDVDAFDQDYGGMKYLNDPERQQLIELVFGDEGLQPDIIKCFLDPFHELVNDNNDPYVINNEGFDHEHTTHYMRYFLEEGLKESRKRNEELTVLAGMYGPPSWMSKQKSFRGRDLDPDMTGEVAEYLVAWTLYLKEKYNANVRYISMHNEGESYNRWMPDGADHPSHFGHDYNMFWTDDNVVDFILKARSILDHHGLTDVGITTGEPAIWTRLYEYSPTEDINLQYAAKIKNNPDAIGSLGLITSHGFDYGGDQFDDRAINLLLEARPELHSWTTSCTWGEMSLEIVEQARGYIYKAKNNGIIPWATVHNNFESDKLHPPGGFRISGNANSPLLTNHGILETTKAYYYFKQLCRAGRAGMKVATVHSSNPEKVSAIAWNANNTKYANAFVLTNHEYTPVKVDVELSGISGTVLSGFITQDYGDKNYSPFEAGKINKGKITIIIPERSVISFFVE